ncbi:MAG: hypothetical protein M0Z60_05235, partial [Nitrospiraceae bacterium]|nr:hypothetical protein [Nitrospiraceae bacterium]
MKLGLPPLSPMTVELAGLTANGWVTWPVTFMVAGGACTPSASVTVTVTDPLVAFTGTETLNVPPLL